MAINLRSPHYVSTAIPNTSYTELDIYIWEGLSTDTTTIKYSLKKYVIAGSISVSYEVSELIKDFLDITFNGDYAGKSIWFKFVIRAYNSSNVLLSTINPPAIISFDSYSYFEENDFNVDTSSVMITNRQIFGLSDNLVRIPVNVLKDPVVTFYKNGVVVGTQSYTNSNNSANKIKYVTVNGEVNFENYIDRIFENNGIYEPNACIISFLNEFEIGEVDKIEVSNNVGKIETINVNVLSECKYEPKKVTFINKFGVLQDMYFFKKAVEQMTVKKESYKANIRNSFNLYSKSSHVNRDFNVSGSESISLSSGFLSEEYNEVFKQLMLSEKVWMTNITATEEQVLPINVKTSNITYKTSLNDRLVEYTIDFDNSFNVINNIR